MPPVQTRRAASPGGSRSPRPRVRRLVALLAVAAAGAVLAVATGCGPDQTARTDAPADPATSPGLVAGTVWVANEAGA